MSVVNLAPSLIAPSTAIAAKSSGISAGTRRLVSEKGCSRQNSRLRD
jgi:hypothetical protein